MAGEWVLRFHWSVVLLRLRVTKGYLRSTVAVSSGSTRNKTRHKTPILKTSFQSVYPVTIVNSYNANDHNENYTIYHMGKGLERTIKDLV